MIPLMTGSRMLMTRNLLYTAVTRARKCVTLVGNPDTFDQMVHNEFEQKRYTTLSDRMPEIFLDWFPRKQIIEAIWRMGESRRDLNDRRWR